jgi:hypothetical protein
MVYRLIGVGLLVYILVLLLPSADWTALITVRLLVYITFWRQASALLTYLRSWALLEEPQIVHSLKNFPAFYGTRRFNTVFTRALYWSLSWAISMQSTPSHPMSLISVVICPLTYVLVFPGVSFLLAFPPISYMHSSSPAFVLHAPPISSFLTWSF